MAGDHLLVTAGEMAFRKMNSVGEFDYLAKEIWTGAKALDNAGHFLPA